MVEPLLAGAVHATVAEVVDATVAVGADGVDGGPAGVTALDGDDARLVPTTLVAVTVKVYEVPLVRPVTVQVRAPVVVQVKPPGLEVTV
jgi:hypothetical protein